MRAFFRGFEKRSAGGETEQGSSGFSGEGKGTDMAGFARNYREGPVGSEGGSGTTDKTMTDMERNPRDFSLFEDGPEFQDVANPHIKY